MMAARKFEYLPMKPLEEFVNADNVCHLSRTIGIPTESIYRWRKEGIPIYRADQIACKTLGVHPAFIWRKEWAPE